MKLRGAISGFGEVAAKAHLPGWLTRPDIQIVAVHDPVPERRHLALRLIKNVRVYEDLELMLAGERLDFLDVATPPALHVPAARAALEAGAHVLVEKPLCLEMRDLDALSALAAAKSRVLMCVHNWKHSPAYRLAHEIVASGRLGALRSLAFERLRTTPAGAGALGGRWRLDPSLGGGILIDHGWHVFYLMTWLVGAAPLDVSAHLESPADTAVDDVANLRVTFPGNRVAYCNLSWRAPIRRTSAVLYGDSAVLEIEPDRARLTERSGKVEEFPISDPPDDSYHATWFSGVARDFELACADPAGSIARINAIESQIALALVLSARRSHQGQGAAIRIDALSA